MPVKRVHHIDKREETDEVRIFGEQRNNFIGPIGTITKLDGEIEFHFPQSTTMTKEQAAFIAAHIITLITT